MVLDVLVGNYFVWVIATCVRVCIIGGSGWSAWTYVREAQCLMFCLMYGMTVRLSRTVMTATSVMLFVRGGSDMSEVVLNCAGCGVSDAARVESSQTSGVVVCSACGEGIDVGHAFAHAPWCLVCGEDVLECVCEGFSCDQCGASLDGVVCVDCMSCPEPAGYWAWDADTLSDYLITLDRAAAHYGARGRDDVAEVVMAQRAWMRMVSDG